MPIGWGHWACLLDTLHMHPQGELKDTITILPLIINGFQHYINDQTITNN